MKVLVTGASGFVGRALVRHLANAGHAVRAAARRPGAVETLAGVEAVELPDLAGAVAWASLIEGVEAVIHAAGLAHARAPGNDTLAEINGGAPGRLAAAMAAAGSNRLVLVSSIRAACGPSSPAPVGSAVEPQPTDAYGRSKLAGERAALAALPTTRILRPPPVHGAGARAGVAGLARLARLPLPLPLAGLKGRRSLVSDANLASAAAFLATTDALSGQAVAASDGAPMTLPAMIAVMRAALGRPPGLFALPGGVERAALHRLMPHLAERLDADLVVDDRPLRAAGWRPLETSAEGLARMVLAQARL